MTDRSHKLSLSRQADLLGINRGSLYYEPRPISEDDLKLMQRIDELHMEYPFAGSRMMKGILRQEGFTVGRLHVATCMKRMGIQALYRKPNTSKPAPGHKIYPYLLRKLAVTRPPTRFGRWTSPTSQWRAGLSILSPCSTDSAGEFWPGGCQRHWKPDRVSKLCKRRCATMANQRS